MVPVMNRPVMEHIIELLKKNNLLNIGVTLQYLPQCIQNYFGDGSEFGISLQYFVEEVPLGTAGSVKNAAVFLDDTFLVISGDGLTDIDLSAAIQFHRENRSVATLVLMEVDSPLEYGVVITDPQGRIIKFLEKPSWGEVFSNKVNTGIYILEPQVLNYINEGQIFDFSKDLFPRLLNDGLPIYGYVATGYWCDIGNLQQYQQSHFDVLSGKAEVNIPGQFMGNGIWIGRNTKVDREAKIKGPVLIGDNSYIGPGAQIESYTIIGDNVVIEEQASLKRSIILENCHIGKKAQLRGATLAKQVQVQGNVSIFEGAVVGDACIIGPHCLIKPNTKIWPSKRIEAGTVVNSSLIWGNCSSRTLFGNRGIVGGANTEITPVLAVKLGSAYGTWLGPGAIVAVGTDQSEISQVIKGALIAGLLSTGVQVKDLGRAVAPITRFNTRRLGLKGSIQIQSNLVRDEKISLAFYESRGVELSRLDEKKIENIMASENFRRAEAHLVGSCFKIEDAVHAYLEGLFRLVNVESIKDRHFRLIVSFQNPFLADLVKPFLAELDCDIFIFEWDSWKNKNQKNKNRQKYENKNTDGWYQAMTKMVISKSADLGIIFDSSMERLTLISDKGQLIDEEMYTVLISLLIFRSQNGGIVAVPINASSVIEQMAEKLQGKVIRTKSSTQPFMDKLLSAEICLGQGSTSQFLLYSDGLLALAQILAHLGEYDLSMSDLLKEVPNFYLSKQIINCPWEYKGKVIRTLIEEKQQEPETLELLEGVKIHHPQGWVLVVPDGEEPVCRVYGEGFSQEIAESLTDWYSDRIRQIGQINE